MVLPKRDHPFHLLTKVIDRNLTNAVEVELKGSQYEGKQLVLVDGSSLAYRSFFALFTTGLRTKSGVPTWAILGFFNSLFDLIERYQPEMLAVCFDLSGPTFRHDEFAEYKANRSEMPDDLAQQWPLIKEGIAKMELPVYELAGYEADDLIGTLARQAEDQKIEIMILTGDQDAFQLVDGESQRVKVLMPGKAGLQLYGRQEVFDKLGVWPEQITDYKGLCGDNSDNIPGIKGIGPKTAVQLLSSYGSIEGVYENIESVTAKALKQKLIEGEKAARDSKRLATIVSNVPTTFDFSHCHLSPPNLETVSSFFGDLEFKNLVKRLPKVFVHFRHEDATAKTSVSETSVAKSRTEVKESAAGSVSVQLTIETATAVVIEREPDLKDNGTSISLIPSPPGNLTIVNSKQAFEALLDRLKTSEPFALNIPTNGGQAFYSTVLGYAFVFTDAFKLDQSKHLAANQSSPNAAPELFFVPLENEGLFNSNALPANEVNDKLRPVLSSSAIGKIVFNAKNATNALFTVGTTLEGIVFDPMLAGYILQAEEKQLLQDQARRLLPALPPRLAEAWGNKKAVGYDKMPIQQMAEIACEEALLATQLTAIMLPQLDEERSFLLYDMELPLSAVLAKMEQTGIALDLSFLETFSRELTSDINRLESEIFLLATHPFNINSTQQLQKVLFEELGLSAKSKTKTGYSTDASVLESLKEEHPIIAKILDFRQLTKLRSTYVDALPKLISPKDRRIHGEFSQTGTSTGRLSSSNPNLQNIPIRSEVGSRMRKAFIPGAANSYLLSADYSQIELRVLAHMSEDPTLIDAFERNQDVHARTAGEIFDKPIEEVSSDMRRVGKTLNFALIYQQGAFATAQALGVTNKEAAQFIEKYFIRYARVKTLLEKTISDAKKSGFVETLWKRRRYFRFLNDRNDPLRRAEERAACNAPFQGSAADLMKLAMITLDQELVKRKLSSKLVLQVHDELVLEVPESELEEVKQVVESAMLQNQPLKVPLQVDIGWGKNWMDVKK
jgi:DNA polymerase-1